MYQVVELYGPFEPWWFLEDWKEDIVKVTSYDTFEEALVAFKKQWCYYKVAKPYYRSKASLLAAFWHEEDQSWCEDCDEPLQDYHSLALLKDWKEVPETYHKRCFEQHFGPTKPLSTCSFKKIG